MTIEIGIIFSLISCILGISGFFIGQKKNSKDDGLTLGKFMGEIKAEINSIKDMIEELKTDNKEVDKKIKDAIIEHEKRYHSN